MSVLNVDSSSHCFCFLVDSVVTGGRVILTIVTQNTVFFLDYHTIPIVKSQLHKKLFNGRRSNYSALICTAVCSASVSGLQIMQKVE